MRGLYANLLILAAALLTHPAAASQPHLNAADSTFFYLTRSWSPSFCRFSRSSDPQACQDASNRFTIHGLWLSCSNGGWPAEESCPGDSYDSSTISSLEPTLERLWPSYGDKGDDAFWDHEWTCHGICAGLVNNDLSSQAAFFQRVLRLDSQSNLDALTQQLQPALDQEMDTSELLQQATQVLGAVPVLTCVYRRNKAYLDSVMSCLSDDLTLVNCQPSPEACDKATLTVPSLDTSRAIGPDDGATDRQQQPLPHRMLRSDERGCAQSPIACTLPSTNGIE